MAQKNTLHYVEGLCVKYPDLISEAVLNSKLTAEVNDVITRGIFPSDTSDLAVYISAVSNSYDNTNLT